MIMKINQISKVFNNVESNIRKVLLSFVLLNLAMITGCISNTNNPLFNLVNGQSEQVSKCRELAPEDPYVDGAKDTLEIYEACKKAASDNPSDSELQYLLGTSALEADKPEESLIAFRKADELGNCKALVFLGDHAFTVEGDSKTAQNYYEQGLECGDERAGRQIFSPDAFESSVEPKLVKALNSGNVEYLNKIRFIHASYLLGFYEALSVDYTTSNFITCWKTTHYKGDEVLNKLKAAEKGDASNIILSRTYEYLLPIAFEVIFPELGSEALEVRRKSLREAGKADFLRLAESSDCGSLVATRFMKTIEDFADSKKTLFQTYKELKPEVNSIDDISSLLKREIDNESSMYLEGE